MTLELSLQEHTEIVWMILDYPGKLLLDEGAVCAKPHKTI